jgi:hypothetical protein
VQMTKAKLVDGSKQFDELLQKVCKVILDRMHPASFMPTNNGTRKATRITAGFIWLRIIPAQLSRLQSSEPAELDCAAAVSVFPSDVRAMVSARFDVRVHVRRSVDSFVVSVGKDNRRPEFFFQELTEPYNSMHALHMVFDPKDPSDQKFVLVEFNADGFKTEGWVDREEAKPWAAEGSKIGSGRPPDFHGTIGASDSDHSVQQEVSHDDGMSVEMLGFIEVPLAEDE